MYGVCTIYYIEVSILNRNLLEVEKCSGPFELHYKQVLLCTDLLSWNKMRLCIIYWCSWM